MASQKQCKAAFMKTFIAKVKFKNLMYNHLQTNYKH